MARMRAVLLVACMCFLLVTGVDVDDSKKKHKRRRQPGGDTPAPPAPRTDMQIAAANACLAASITQYPNSKDVFTAKTMTVDPTKGYRLNEFQATGCVCNILNGLDRGSGPWTAGIAGLQKAAYAGKKAWQASVAGNSLRDWSQRYLASFWTSMGANANPPAFAADSITNQVATYLGSTKPLLTETKFAECMKSEELCSDLINNECKNLPCMRIGGQLKVQSMFGDCKRTSTLTCNADGDCGDGTGCQGTCVCDTSGKLNTCKCMVDAPEALLPFCDANALAAAAAATTTTTPTAQTPPSM